MRKSKYTEEDFINRCKELNLEYIGTYKKKHDGSMVQFICPKHRDKGVQETAFSHLRKYAKGCPYCTGRYKTTEDIIPLIKNKDVELISEYLGNEKPIKCRCKVCGNEWVTLTKVLTTNGSGCPECGKIKRANAKRKTLDQFQAEMKIVNPDIEIIGDYKGTHTKITCRCKKCNNVWETYPVNLLNQTSSCPVCNLSKSERMMLNELKTYGLNIETQYTIKDCRYIHPLKFDAFDLEHNIAFEYNGEQHYQPIDYAGKGEQWAIEQLHKTQERDKAKYQYCEENNIPIIIIPYWEKDNMNTIIKNRLDELGVSKN